MSSLVKPNMTTYTDKMKEAKEAVTNIPKILLKSINKIVPFCSKCDTELLGNGSGAMPYICECGEWEFDKKLKIYILPND